LVALRAQIVRAIVAALNQFTGQDVDAEAGSRPAWTGKV
jgi:hypothetical protein